jgi:ribosome-binding protein aMBF1 (putative translation factor)
MNAADETPAASTYQRRFGSWDRAKRLAIRGDRDADMDSGEDSDDLAAAEPRDPETVPLGSDLAAAREDLGLSQADLADAVGVSPGAVAHWETRDVTPTPENAGRLHKTLQRLQTSEEKSRGPASSEQTEAGRDVRNPQR